MTSSRLCSQCGKTFSGEAATCDECTETTAQQAIPEIPGYSIIGIIGRGGIGEVYLARDVSLGRQVAIKFISKELLNDLNVHARFLREARIMATVEHPNVVRIYSFGEAGGRAYLVMEYVEGRTLAGLIHEKEKLAVQDALQILEQIAEGLEAVAEKQVVHRDIKPHNILIHSRGRVCVGDFGLAKGLELDDLESQTVTKTGSILGSPAYISPEQARGQTADLRSDLYSLGIVFYEMLAGRRPYSGNIVEVLTGHLHSPLPPLSKKRDDVPARVQQLLNRLTEKDPDRRPQSYPETLKLIRDCLSESKARRSLVTTIALIAAVVAIFFLGYFFWTRFSEKKPVKQITFDPSKYHQITFTGHAGGPEISPDGKWVAYYDDQNRIIVQRINGSENLVVVRDAAPFAPIKWSPDGSQLIVYVIHDRTDAWLYLVPATGGEPRRTGNYGPFSCWKPDGSEIVASDATGTMVSFWDTKSGQIKWLTLKSIYKNEFLSRLHCLPNNILLGTITRAKGQSLVRIAADGEMTELLGENDFWESFSNSDGTQIYFLGGDAAVEVYSVKADDLLNGAKPKLFATLSYEENVNYVSVSNNGVLAFDKNSSQSNLWLSKLNKSDTEWSVVPLTSGTWSVNDPSISPDGTRIAMCVAKEKSDLYTMLLEGGSMKQITFSGVGCRSPVWSQDGARIAFFSRPHDQLSISMVPSEGGETKILQAKEISFSRHMSWAPGVEIIYQKSGNRQYYFLNPDSGKTEPLFDDKVFRGWWFSPRYSPDGSKLAFKANFPPRHGIFIVSKKDRDLKFLGESEIEVSRWSADGNWIYGFDDEKGELYKVNATTGNIVKMASPTIDSEYRLGALDVAPDQKTFIIQGTKFQSDIWTVDTHN